MKFHRNTKNSNAALSAMPHSDPDLLCATSDEIDNVVVEAIQTIAICPVEWDIDMISSATE